MTRVDREAIVTELIDRRYVPAPQGGETVLTYLRGVVDTVLNTAERLICTCNTGPNTEGPEETCPVDGRGHDYWLERADELQRRMNEIGDTAPGRAPIIAADDRGILTPDEHGVIQSLGTLWGDLCTIVDHGPTRDADLAELIVHVHALQHAILGQAAARTYPDLYRLLGSSLQARDALLNHEPDPADYTF